MAVFLLDKIVSCEGDAKRCGLSVDMGVIVGKGNGGESVWWRGMKLYIPTR